MLLAFNSFLDNQKWYIIIKRNTNISILKICPIQKTVQVVNENT